MNFLVCLYNLHNWSFCFLHNGWRSVIDSLEFIIDVVLFLVTEAGVYDSSDDRNRKANDDQDDPHGAEFTITFVSFRDASWVIFACISAVSCISPVWNGCFVMNSIYG